MKRCRGCEEELTKDNDSEAHVIPNALGGRLKPKGIICRSCNAKLNDLVDEPLVKAFGVWPTLLNFPRDRDSHPNATIKTKHGRQVRAEPNGKLTAIDVRYDVRLIEEGHQVEIAAGNKKTIQQLVQRAKKQFPALDVAAEMQHARTVAAEPDDELIVRFDFSPQAVFGGIVTAVWLFLILKTGHSVVGWDRLVEIVQNMQESGGTFRYMVDGLPGLDGPEVPIGHKIIVRSVPETGHLIVYVEILGVLKVGGIFADSGGPTEPLEHIYVYDVLNEADRSWDFSIDGSVFDKQSWREVGLGPEQSAELRPRIREELNTFVAQYEVYHAAQQDEEQAGALNEDRPSDQAKGS